jgi:7-cyano-7-deazaguanine synthase
MLQSRSPDPFTRPTVSEAVPNDNPPSSAVVLLSGGQDSTTCLFWAKNEFEYVEAVGFDYGQKHHVELEQARRIADMAEVSFTVFNLKGLMQGSALTEHHKDVAGRHERNPNLPASFVPNRNAIFLDIAAGHAYMKGIFDLVGGMCETDSSGYPDCRREFIEAKERSLSLGLNEAFRIHTPLMYLNKAQTWKMAHDLGVLDVVRDFSHTDYNGDRTTYNEWGYGRLDNDASILRARGYEQAKANGWLG